MAATVIAFPARGGNGFRIPMGMKNRDFDRDYDHANLISYTWGLSKLQYLKEQERYPEEKDFSFERTPEMLICMAIFQAMPSDQRAKAMMAANEVYVKSCDEEARIASNLLAALSLVADETKRGRK